MGSKLEINIRTLIAQCEEIADKNNKDWRLKKYVKSLDTMIKELEETEPSNIKSFKEYVNRCNGLKILTNYNEIVVEDKNKIKPKIINSYEMGDQSLREINQYHNAKYHSELRKDLIGQNNLEVNLRKRIAASDSTNKPDDMGQALKHYSDLQEKIAEDMLSLTRNLKEQTETANKIIKKDTETVTKSSLLSDKNITSLNSEAEKLQDHSKKAWKCWMWLMIALVVMIFLGMVLFMKIVKKKLK